MLEYFAVAFQFFLYFAIVALVAYWLFPLDDKTEKYFDHKVVWITGKSRKFC